MSTISWGKITVYERAYRPGAYSSAHQFTALSIPVEGSSQLNITQGESKEAKQEGGELVDKKNAANTYEFVFRLFVKKTDLSAYPANLESVNGSVEGEHEFKIVPEDPACYGLHIPRSTVTCVENMTSEEGITLEYHVTALLDSSTATGHPNNGRLVNIAVQSVSSSGISVSNNTVDFSSSADSTGMTVLVNCPNAFSASSSETFATVEETGNAVNITVSANTSGSARTATITVTDSVTGDTAVITVNQAG